jgi:hypothetical protein
MNDFLIRGRGMENIKIQLLRISWFPRPVYDGGAIRSPVDEPLSPDITQASMKLRALSPKKAHHLKIRSLGKNIMSSSEGNLFNLYSFPWGVRLA